jgi:signal transduction histidine kinase
LSAAYEDIGNLSNALTEFKNFITLKDEINAADTATRLQNQQISARVESLEKENKMLEVEKMAAIGQLTAGVAHEINNPVNFIASNISPVRKNIADIIMLLQQYETAMKNNPGSETLKILRQSLEIDFAIDETGELLKGIENGAHRIREIVNALRVITRLDEESFKVADVHEEIDAVLLMLQNKISSNLVIKKEFGNVTPFEHFPALLSQALMNVLQNAIEAASESGTVIIRTFENDTSVHVIITDSGKGMNDKVKRKIFEPFFTTKEVGAGLGLGLSVARSIVEQHRGSIELESEPGKGTVVKMILPKR